MEPDKLDKKIVKKKEPVKKQKLVKKAEPVKKKEPVKKAEPVKKKEPIKKKEPVKKKITIEYQGPRKEELNENKYSEKIKSLITKIKNQNTEYDHGIRFCWKN